MSLPAQVFDAVAEMQAIGHSLVNIWSRVRKWEIRAIQYCCADKRRINDLCKEQRRIQEYVAFLCELPHAVHFALHIVAWSRKAVSYILRELVPGCDRWGIGLR
jgi:hypothetical protein